MRSAGALILMSVLPGCNDAIPEGRGHVRFLDLFDAVQTVRLEETAADPIIGVERVAVGPGGVIVFPDRQAERVRLFDPDGTALGVVGRPGGGPGELSGLADAFLDSGGRLYTSDAGNGRISRFDSDLRFDTAFAAPGIFAFRLIGRDHELIVATHERGGSRVWRLDEDGRRIAELTLPDSAAWSVPYWGSVLDRDLTWFAGDLIVTNSLLYPIWRLRSGEEPDSLGRPPPSFREASRPVLGQFAGANQAEVQNWLRTFTQIDRVVPYRDSLLLVIHSEYGPVPGYPRASIQTGMDIYDRAGDRLYFDIALPGRVLSGGEYLLVLSGEPPVGWIITSYQWTL